MFRRRAPGCLVTLVLVVCVVAPVAAERLAARHRRPGLPHAPGLAAPVRPRSWSVEGGMARLHAVDTRPELLVQSPDRRILIRPGEAAGPFFMQPNNYLVPNGAWYTWWVPHLHGYRRAGAGPARQTGRSGMAGLPDGY